MAKKKTRKPWKDIGYGVWCDCADCCEGWGERGQVLNDWLNSEEEARQYLKKELKYHPSCYLIKQSQWTLKPPPSGNPSERRREIFGGC